MFNALAIKCIYNCFAWIRDGGIRNSTPGIHNKWIQSNFIPLNSLFFSFFLLFVLFSSAEPVKRGGGFVAVKQPQKSQRLAVIAINDQKSLKYFLLFFKKVFWK